MSLVTELFGPVAVDLTLEEIKSLLVDRGVRERKQLSQVLSDWAVLTGQRFTQADVGDIMFEISRGQRI